MLMQISGPRESLNVNVELIKEHVLESFLTLCLEELTSDRFSLPLFFFNLRKE